MFPPSTSQPNLWNPTERRINFNIAKPFRNLAENPHLNLPLESMHAFIVWTLPWSKFLFNRVYFSLIPFIHFPMEQSNGNRKHSLEPDQAQPGELSSVPTESCGQKRKLYAIEEREESSPVTVCDPELEAEAAYDADVDELEQPVGCAPPGKLASVREVIYELFQPWALKTYGDQAKTKTITLRKKARILKALEGKEHSRPDSSKFRFWVKTKGKCQIEVAPWRVPLTRLNFVIRRLHHQTTRWLWGSARQSTAPAATAHYSGSLR